MITALLRLRILLAVLVLGLVAGACASESGDTAGPADEPGVNGATENAGETENAEITAGAEADADPFDNLKEAATHVAEMSAPALASGITQAVGIDGVDSEGAQLRRALSGELQEHVYLAAITLEQVLLDRQAAADAAAAALDENSVELADLVGSVAPDQRETFLQLWRNHIGFFVDYTVGVKTGDQAAQDQARQQLAQYRQDAGVFFEQVTGGALPADAVASSLAEHVDTVLATIDSFAAGDAAAFDQLKTAADHVANMSGPALAGGIAQAIGMEGVDSSGALILTNLSTLLQEHVYLTGIFVEQALADTGLAEQAKATLDTNSVALADLVGSVAPDQREAFLQLWRNHIGFFEAYTVGVATGDQAAQDQARQQLAQYRQDAGVFFEQVTGGALPADAVASSLAEHVDTTIAAIDSLAVALGVTSG